MGKLHYGTHETAFDFDDYLLHHLKIVIANKLQRGESFVFSWQTSADGAGASLWLHPSIPIFFTFESLDIPELNRAWAEQLAIQANRPAGLTIIDEPSTFDTSPRESA